MSVLSLADLKVHANITSSSYDDELQLMLNAAEAWVGRYLGASLGGGPVTYKVRSSGRALVLPATGLATVATITDPNGLTVTADDADLASGVITVPYARASGAWTVAVTFATDVPADVELAVYIIAAHLFETQRGTSPSALALQQQQDFAEHPPGVSYAIPYRAQALLEPYSVPTVA